MELVVIYAAANCGKTTMLENVIHFLQPELILGECRSVVISVNGVQIGIALDGDDEQTVSNNLEAFRKEKCDLIVTPSHVRDKTVDVVKEFAQQYKIAPIWIKKSELSEYLKDYYDELNKCEAKCLVDYLKRHFI
ncbi:hypothetical protein F544_8310 [Bibersteinia trehalosi USDA-ARS-USMARC-190]|uniref:Uncharacterized protein n=1 Tax=Bibersteinia trehalosi USDA-ARS-USMARC-190 TaxID=1263832 RepID=W0R6Y7_BIBTR|nr:hypothetical protein [Bibersteinia trehalosi]AHG86060.1 hypothetical protein F544_8310 [Bibersteinia trehalosi USDA-ARS-USMARC-190]